LGAALDRLPLRRLFFGPPPAADRIFFSEVWFRGHNNPRYAELLPRLERLDRYLFLCSDRRVVRGLQFRALHRTTSMRYRLMFAAAGRRYASLLVADRGQIRYFPGAIVADCDDARPSAEEVQLLSRPNVRAYVVLAERVGRRYQDLGLEKPCHVIPHGVGLRSLDPQMVRDVARHYRTDGEVVIGYMAGSMLSGSDRNGEDPMYNIDHLFELWEEIRRRVPRARLWLLGNAGKGVRRRCDSDHDITLFGRVPREKVLAYASNFDIALYPRTADHENLRATKVVEYMGCGVPTVSYDYEMTSDLRETNAGLLATTPREFVEAVERLAHDGALRKELGAAARTAGAARDWDRLARRYADILDSYL
jgi:glycosyltransferase involved in cell wall biosynthesis